MTLTRYWLLLLLIGICSTVYAYDYPSKFRVTPKFCDDGDTRRYDARPIAVIIGILVLTEVTIPNSVTCIGD